WRGSWNADGGGVMMNQAVHYIDLLLWFMGDVVEVSGRLNSFKHADNIEVEDSAVATLTFASGAMATLNLTTSATPAFGATVHVTTRDGSSMTLLESPEGTEGRLINNGHGDHIDSTAAYPEGIVPNVDLRTINDQLIPFHTQQVANFIDALLGTQQLLVDGPEATKALRTLLAVYQSHRTGQPVLVGNGPAPPTVRVPEDIGIERIHAVSTRELGVAPLSALNTSPEDFIYQAQEVGFDFVGLRVIPVTPQEPQYDLSEGSELFHKVIKALDRTGLYVKDAEFILLDGTD